MPTKASLYVDNALKPLYQLQNEHSGSLKANIINEWLKGSLSGSAQKYYETVSDVLNSVKKMEESLKRLKQARKTVSSNVSSNGSNRDDNKIRLQLALDVEHFGDQIQKIGLNTNDIQSFQALSELAMSAREQATIE